MATGRCNCGAVSVTVNGGLPDKSLLCHCLNCRASGGTAFSTNLVVKKSDLVISGEEHTKVYRDKNTASGHVALRRFCGTCGSPIVTIVEGDDEMQFLKAGLFGAGTPNPSAELFSHRAEPWEKKHDDAERK